MKIDDVIKSISCIPRTGGQSITEGDVIPLTRTVLVFNIDYYLEAEDESIRSNLPASLKVKVPVKYNNEEELEDFLMRYVTDEAGYFTNGFDYKLIKPSDSSTNFVAEVEDYDDWLKKNHENTYDGYRGVSEHELKQALKTSHPLPSSDLMPFDGEVIEYGMGGKNYTEEEVEEWVKNIVPWYDGSLKSVKNGVNFTTDESNAEGYGEYVLALKVNCPVAYFSDVHCFAEDYRYVDVVAYKKFPDTDKWIKVGKK